LLMRFRRSRFAVLVLAVLMLSWTVNVTLASVESGASDVPLSPVVDPETAVALRQDRPVVHAVLFWSQTCPHCHFVIDNVLPAIKEQYRDQFNVLLVEMRSQQDWASLVQTAALFDIPQASVGVPFLVIGDKALLGSGEIPSYLPGLIEAHLARGGLELPDIPGIDRGIPFALPGEEICEAGTDCVETAVLVGQQKPDGHNLAIAIMVGMVGALAYVGTNTVRYFRTQARFRAPKWLEQTTPWLAVVGLGVAGYMAYVETQAVEAVCGPVGDCNAVQSSPYAKLFGVLPIGVLGVVGYIAILLAWFWTRLRRGQSVRQARWAVLAMTTAGTLFSLYLTYLEPFVIKAVCAWCLTSAVIITLLMLVNLSPALQPVRGRARR